MTTDSGWDIEMSTGDGDNAFTDITALGGHRHGYCDLYRARRHGKWHVLKALKPEYRDTPACQAMLRKEFDIGFHLSHPGIAATLGLEQVESLGECIIEEWVDGITLDKYIAGHDFSAAKARHIIAQLCEVLKYIHARQIVHRDLKPSNILITADGDSVKVIDFGVSDTASYAILKGPAGTRAYAAPELMAGENVDSRADIFSLGVIIGQMNSLLPRQDRRLAKVAKWCSAVDPAQRPASSGEVLKALQRPSSRRYYYLAAIVVAAAIAAIVWTMLPDRSSRRDVAATSSAPTVDTVATSTTAPVQQAEKQDSTAQDQPIPSIQPVQQDETPAVTSPNRQVPQEQPAPEPELSPNMRQLYLAKTAQVGYNEARKSRARLLEVYRSQGQELFDQHITESLRERIELEVINVANNMFPAGDPRFKPLREYMASPAGRQLIDAGRQEALERAQIILHEAFPDLTIPPFPAAAPNWQDRKQ